MRKRDREHSKQNRENMHFYALEELEKRKEKRRAKKLLQLTEQSQASGGLYSVT